MTTSDVAKKLGCSDKWITRLLRTRQLKGTKSGRDWWIEEAELDAYLRRKAVKTFARKRFKFEIVEQIGAEPTVVVIRSDSGFRTIEAAEAAGQIELESRTEPEWKTEIKKRINENGPKQNQ